MTDRMYVLLYVYHFEGSVIVTTPQDVVLDDVKRAISMFRKVNVPVSN